MIENREQHRQKLSPEEQFQHPDVLHIGGANIEVHDVYPEGETNEIPTVFFSGFSASPKTYDDAILNIVKSGRRVISPDAPHGVDAEPQDGYPAAELRKVAALMQTLEAKGVEKIDAVGHSEAGIVLTIAATLYPEKFRNLVFMNPAGMVGKDTFPRIAAGFSTDIIKAFLSKDILRAGEKLLPCLKTVARHPIQSLREVLAIADTDIRDMLVELRKKGIGVSVIKAVDDDAFPIERTARIDRDPNDPEDKNKGGISKEHVDGFYAVTGSHTNLILHPDRYSRLAAQALTDLKKRPVPKPQS